MGWYICNDCGHIFEDGEQKFFVEKHGLDTPPYEGWSCCPVCYGTYDEAKRCDDCGAYFSKYDLTDGLCKECVDNMVFKYKYDIMGCYKIADFSQPVQVNAFLASMFTDEQINEILLRELVGAATVAPVDCSPFINEDKSWFEDKVVKEVKKQ